MDAPRKSADPGGADVNGSNMEDCGVNDPLLEGADLERRFGGLRRLYGDAGYARIRAARVAVVGVGGVGSWAAEALARCGVAQLVLVDLDHVAESNINRQVQAESRTLGQAKVRALAERIAHIHPRCDVVEVEDFVTADNWPQLLAGAGVHGPLQAVIDACDQVNAKLAMAMWAMQRNSAVPSERAPTALICVGAAGGKRQPHAVQVANLLAVTHDPLLASLRQRLRQAGAVPKGTAGPSEPAARGDADLRPLPMCVFSREPVLRPQLAACTTTDVPAPSHDLNCHGYGSVVTVTAAFGMAAAATAIDAILAT